MFPDNSLTTVYTVGGVTRYTACCMLTEQNATNCQMNHAASLLIFQYIGIGYWTI